MKIEILKSLFTHLIEIEPSDSPMISCFIKLEQPRSNYFDEIKTQAELVGKRLGGRQRRDFEDALEEIREYLNHSLEPASKSVALYSRWGDAPVFVAKQFEAPLETHFVVDQLPHVYPLVDQGDSEIDLREELVRLAVAQGVLVETVKHNKALKRFGGVGCLLRYHPDPVSAEKIRFVA